MRKVDRSNVPIPNCLINLSVAAQSHLLNYKKISGAIYAHADVIHSLALLYFDKCYICERDVSSGRYDVEHYLPKKHFPNLGYTWSNLHKACSGCNLAKENKNFFFYNEMGNCIDAKLLDPASVDYNISDYLSFDINSCAQSPNIGTDPILLQKANNTILYLNGFYDSDYGKELKYLRENKSSQFLRFCCSSNLIYMKNRISQLRFELAAYVPPIDKDDLEIDQRICQLLINADEEYLSDSASFSSSTRVHLFPILGITYANLVLIKKIMKNSLGM